MKNRLFRLGGGAGVGSFIIVLENDTIKNPEALRIRQSYDCGESLYLSIIDEVTEEALLPLSGYVDEQDILHLSGRDFDDNKTYEIDIDEENDTVELNTVDGITMGEGTIPTEGGGGDAVIILDNEHPEPEDITDLKKLYRRDGNIPSNLQQPALIHQEGVDSITEAQVETNNVQVTASNISTFFDLEFNNVVEVTGTTMNLFSFRIVENDTPISAIRVGPRSEDVGVLEIQPKGTTTKLRIGKYFYLDYETGERVYDTAATVMVDGITYTFDSDDEILEIETDSEDIIIRNGGAEYSRILIYSIETQGDPVDEWALDPLDSVREREEAVSGLENTLMNNHITPTETTVASHTTDIQNLKVGVRDLGTALATTNSHIGNIKVDSIDRLPQPAYEYLNQIYRVDGKYYECYISVPGDAQYFEWMFNVNGTSEITSSNWDSFAGDVGNGFKDNTNLSEINKCYRNAGSIKLGSSSSVGYVEFDIDLDNITQIEIDYAGYSASKPSHLNVFIEDGSYSDDFVIDATDNERHTFYLNDLGTSQPTFRLQSNAVETTDDKRFIIYGIRVHAGTPATYAWREISNGGGGGGDTPTKKGKFLPNVTPQNITVEFKEYIDYNGSGEVQVYSGNREGYKTINDIGYIGGVPAIHNPDPYYEGNDLWYKFVGETEIDGTPYDRWFYQHADEDGQNKDWYVCTNVVVDANSDYIGADLDIRDQVQYFYYVDDPEEPTESYYCVQFPVNIMPLRYRNAATGIDWIFDYKNNRVVNSAGTSQGWLFVENECVRVEKTLNNFAVGPNDHLEYMVVNGASMSYMKLNTYGMINSATTTDITNALNNALPRFSISAFVQNDHPIDWTHRGYFIIGGTKGWFLKEMKFSCTYGGTDYPNCKLTYDEANNAYVLTDGPVLPGTLTPTSVVNDSDNTPYSIQYSPTSNTDAITNVVVISTKSEAYSGTIIAPAS